MEFAKITIGLIILAIGFLTFIEIINENGPTPNNPSQVVDFSKFTDTTFAVIVEAVILAIGVVILDSGIRSSQFSNRRS